MWFWNQITDRQGPMLIILNSELTQDSPELSHTLKFLAQLPNVSVKLHEVKGAEQTLTEVYLIGNTQALDCDEIAALPGVEQVIRISDEYRILDRKSTRLNSSHVRISYAVFCLKKKTGTAW